MFYPPEERSAKMDEVSARANRLALWFVVIAFCKYINILIYSNLNFMDNIGWSINYCS